MTAIARMPLRTAAAVGVMLALLSTVGPAHVRAQDGAQTSIDEAQAAFGGDITEETVARLDDLALHVDGPQREEIASLRTLARTLLLQERYGAALRETAVLLELEDELFPSDAGRGLQGAALTGFILGGSTFLAGAAMWFDTPDTAESVLPLTVGGAVAVGSGVALLLSPRIVPQASAPPVVTIRPRTVTDAPPGEWRSSLLEERRTLTSELADSVAALPRLRRRGRYALTAGVTGAAASAATFILGQVAFREYNNATFTEDAVALRRQVNTYRILSATSVAVSTASLSVWQWLRLRIERPRELIRDIDAIDAALAAPPGR
ncbi:MAG: hypothetical protein ACOCYC_03905 [bacterium]